MNRLIWIALLASLSLPAYGQATRDRNLVATRKHSDVSSSLPPQIHTGQSGQKDANSQLDKLERQTANTVIQPAAKSSKTPAYKLPSDARPAAASAYQQSMPVRAPIKNTLGSGSPNRSSRSNRVNRYGR